MKKSIPGGAQSTLHFAECPKSWASVTGLQHLIIFEANPHFFCRLFLSEPLLLTNFYQVLSSSLERFIRIRHADRISTLLSLENQRRVGNRLTPAAGLVRTLSLKRMLTCFALLRGKSCDMNYDVLEIPENLTARSRIVAILTQEILTSPETKPFAIESENQLCRRFSVSRVTVRHALSDLEHRGLIYRKQGKGTFAHGHATRVNRNIALLFKPPQSIEQQSIFELMRGAQGVTASLRSALILVSTSPREWRPDMTSSLGGVIIMPDEVTIEELDILRECKLRFISIGASHLPKPRFIPGAQGLSFFQAGQQAAEILSRAAVTGESLRGFSIAHP